MTSESDQPQDTAPRPETMTTYRRADGDLIHGEWSFACDRDSITVEAEDADEPTEYVEEVWQLVRSTTLVGFPAAYSCQVEACDEDAAGWRRTEDGTWQQACAEHGGIDRGRIEVIG